MLYQMIRARPLGLLVPAGTFVSVAYVGRQGTTYIPGCHLMSSWGMLVHIFPLHDSREPLPGSGKSSILLLQGFDIR